jgi:hypothetical protein
MNPYSLRTAAAEITYVSGTAVTLAMVVWGWYEWRRKGRCQMFVLLIGSIIGWLNDPAFQTVANIRPDAPTAVSPAVFGYLNTPREPLWCVFTYPMWICLVTYLAFYAMAEQWPRRRLWLIFIVTSVVDVAAEIFYIRTGMYSYQGGQAFQVFGMPIAWGPTYMSMCILLGTLLYLLNQKVRGWQWLFAIPLVGSGYLALTFIAGWPMAIGSHTSPGQPWISLWALAAMAIETGMVYLLSLYLPRSARGTEVAPDAGQPIREEIRS